MVNKKNSCRKEKLSGTGRNAQYLGNLSLLFIWGFVASLKDTIFYIHYCLTLPLFKHSISAKAQTFLPISKLSEL